MNDLIEKLESILDNSKASISTILPADWAKSRIIMPAPYPGPLRYQGKTAYTEEIINRFSPFDPARVIVVMGAAQWGKTATIIVPVIGYIIENCPGPIIMTVGHEGLLKEAMEKVEFMLDTTGLRSLIRPSSQRARSNKTGDTDSIKQFPLGYLKASAAGNPKIWRQSSYQFGLVDDYDAVKSDTKVAGSVDELIDKRFTAFSKTKKILKMSSPELESTSNIYQAYLQGDQRKFLVPCPCCGVCIELVWSTKGKKGQAGITWKLDEEGVLIESSVGYICQECGDFFTDQYKTSFIDKGYWNPTTKPSRPGFYSYYMSCLYSPPGMDDWLYYVYEYLKCTPEGRPRNAKEEKKYQTFLNLNLGLPYKPSNAEAPKANQLQKNIFNYEIDQVPEKLSEKHGNGKIVLLTFSCDLNGLEEDARVDWEVKAFAENESCYSIAHGSIGTFVFREKEKKHKEDRAKWSYQHNQSNSVWPEITKILEKVYDTGTGRRMKVFIAGIDTGHFTTLAYSYVDYARGRGINIVSLKGDKIKKSNRIGGDVKSFQYGKERPHLFILNVNHIKDNLSQLMKLKYDKGNDDSQPDGFMNFPNPSGGKYLFENFFKHYESEHKITDDGEENYHWEKVTTISQNHFWDVCVYGLALKDIVVDMVGKASGIKGFEWSDYVNALLGRK